MSKIKQLIFTNITDCHVCEAGGIRQTEVEQVACFTFLSTTADPLGNFEADLEVVIRRNLEVLPLLGISKLIPLLCGISLFLLHIFKFMPSQLS